MDAGFDRAHVVESCLAVAASLDAPPPADQSLSFTPGEAATAAAEALLAPMATGSGPTVAIHPGGGAYSLARRWPAARFADVADGLARRGNRVVVVGRRADDTAGVVRRLSAPTLDLTDRTDLPTLAAVLGRMDLLVTNDSGVMHLATAVGTPVVAVFGPSNPVAWGPWTGGGRAAHRIVALDLPCRPCLYVDHALGSPAGCPTRDCLTWLAAERVLDAAIQLLDDDPAG